jgi:hypothetical protein
MIALIYTVAEPDDTVNGIMNPVWATLDIQRSTSRMHCEIKAAPKQQNS